MSVISSQLVEINDQKEEMRLKLENLKRKAKLVGELMTKHKKLLPNCNEGKVKNFMKSAAEV